MDYFMIYGEISWLLDSKLLENGALTYFLTGSDYKLLAYVLNDVVVKSIKLALGSLYCDSSAAAMKPNLVAAPLL